MLKKPIFITGMLIAATVQAQLAWVAERGGQMPLGALVAGQDNGVPLVVCRIAYQRGIHPGKLGEGSCNIGWGGAEISAASYEVLVVNPRDVRWVPARDGELPPFAIMGGQENGRQLPICHANHRGGTHPGKLVGNACNIGSGGAEVQVSAYEVLTAAPFRGRPFELPAVRERAGGSWYCSTTSNFGKIYPGKARTQAEARDTAMGSCGRAENAIFCTAENTTCERGD